MATVLSTMAVWLATPDVPLSEGAPKHFGQVRSLGGCPRSALQKGTEGRSLSLHSALPSYAWKNYVNRKTIF
jgi:hypothetical protein